MQTVMRKYSVSLWCSTPVLLTMQPAKIPSIILTDYIIQTIGIAQSTGETITTMPKIEADYLLPIIQQVYAGNENVKNIGNRIQINAPSIWNVIQTVGTKEAAFFTDMKEGKSIPLYAPGFICFHHVYCMINALITGEIDIFKM